MSTIQSGKQLSTQQTDTLRPENYFKVADNMLYPPLYRAAYSDRMAWVLASMSQLAYERFENEESPARRLRPSLKVGSSASN